MKINMMGEPRPENFEEIDTTLIERGIDPGAAFVRVETDTDDGFGKPGWIVEVTDGEDPENRFSSCALGSGQADLEDITGNLTRLGFLPANVEVDLP